jgi:dihydroorotase
MSTIPARIFNLSGGTLAPGAPADVLVADPKVRWTVDPAEFFSKSRNTPFAGRQLIGRADVTIVSGQVVFERARRPGASVGRTGQEAGGREAVAMRPPN